MSFQANPHDHPAVMIISNLLDKLVDHVSGVDEIGDLAGSSLESILNFALDHITAHKNILC